MTQAVLGNLPAATNLDTTSASPSSADAMLLV
jgi:hypothetical protein